MTTLWQVTKVLWTPAAGAYWIPFIFAVLVGAVIFLWGTNDKNVNISRRERIVGGFIAFVNSMVLFLAALGFTR